MTKEVTIHFMPNNPNGASYRPEVEDVPKDLYDKEVCVQCGGELVEKLIGDELITYCPDCGM